MGTREEENSEDVTDAAVAAGIGPGHPQRADRETVSGYYRRTLAERRAALRAARQAARRDQAAQS